MVKKEHNRHDPKRRRCNSSSSTLDDNKQNQYCPDAAASISSSLNNQQLSSSVEQQQQQQQNQQRQPIIIDVDVDVDAGADADNNYAVTPSARDISNLLGKIDNYHHSHATVIWHDERQELVTADADATTADATTAPAVIQALKQLQEWLALALSLSKKDDDEIGRTRILGDMLEQFHCFGGITRVLVFLDTAVTIVTRTNILPVPRQHPQQYNTQMQMQMNTDIIGAVTKFLSFLLSFRWNTTNENANATANSNENGNTNALQVNTNNNKIKNLAIEMAKMIVRRNGIELLLRCCSVSNNINNTYMTSSSLLITKQHIWTVLGRTINIHNGQQVETDSKGIVDKRQTLCILHHATTDCISILGKIDEKQQQNNNNHNTNNNNESTRSMSMSIDVLQVIFYTIANTIKDDSLGKEELKQTNIKSACLRSLLLLLLLKKKKNFGGNINSSIHNSNNNNEEVVTYTLGILTILSRKKVFSKKKDFEHLLPTLVYCLTYFQGQHNNHQIRSFVLILLELSCEKLDTQTMEDSGVLEAIPAVLLGKQPNSSSDYDNDHHHHHTTATTTTTTTIIISEETKEKARNIMRMILK